MSRPPVTRRQYQRIWIVAWCIAFLIHGLLFWGAGWYIDFRSAQIEIEMAWGNDPLLGFGMMEEAFFEEEPEASEGRVREEVLPETDPFDEDVDSVEWVAQPDLDPNSIVIPEPESEALPSYALARDPERLAAVRKDMETLPNLHVLAPGNAKLIVLIRNDRVLGSRFEHSVRRLFKSFPDYRFALGASQIDPIRDIDAMLIATANPQLYAETFLVVSHRLKREDLKAAITSSFPTDLLWQEYEGQPLAVPDSQDGKYDPRSGIYKRSLYLPDDQTVLFLRPEVLPSLKKAHVDAVVKVRDAAVAEDSGQVETFLESLGGIGGQDSASMPTLFIAAQGIESIRLGRNFPEISSLLGVRASLSTSDQPHLNLEATFSTPAEAQAFVDLWPQIMSTASSIGIPGLGGILSSLALTPEGSSVLVSGDLNGTMIGLVLMFAAQHLNRTR